MSQKKRSGLKVQIVGVFSDEGPPVPIPNTEVKLISADNTWLEAAREDKAMPTQYHLRILRWLNSLNALIAQSVGSHEPLPVAEEGEV